MSLRETARETGLSLSTVRSIVGRGERRRDELRRIRTEAPATSALPSRVNDLLRRGRELAKRTPERD